MESSPLFLSIFFIPTLILDINLMEERNRPRIIAIFSQTVKRAKNKNPKRSLTFSLNSMNYRSELREVVKVERKEVAQQAPSEVCLDESTFRKKTSGRL